MKRVASAAERDMMLLASCNWDWCVLGRAASSGLDEGGLNVEKVLARWICGGINDEYSRAMKSWTTTHSPGISTLAVSCTDQGCSYG